MSTKSSPFKSPEIYAAAITAGASLLGGLFGRGQRRREQREANEEVRLQKQRYLDMEITNPYATLTNPYAGMENVAEDLTVNQRAANFQAQQGAQQRANIMAGLSGAAGASGIASLAQALSMQQTQESERIASSIAQQETANQRLAAQQAGRIQQMQAAGEMQVQARRAYGDMLAEQRRFERQEILLTGAYQRAAAAREAQVQNAQNIIGGISQATGMWAKGGFMVGDKSIFEI